MKRCNWQHSWARVLYHAHAWIALRLESVMQVTRPGAIDPSVIDTTEDQEYIGRARKKVWIATTVGYFLLFILWPCLMAPAGGTWSIGYFRWASCHVMKNIK